MFLLFFNSPLKLIFILFLTLFCSLSYTSEILANESTWKAEDSVSNNSKKYAPSHFELQVLKEASLAKTLEAAKAWGYLDPDNPKVRYQNVFSLQGAADRALTENFSVKASQSEAEAAESGRKSALGAFGPSLSTSYGYTHREVDEEDLYNWRVWLKQDLFTGFATLSSYQKAALEADNAKSSLDKARLALIFKVQQNFFIYIQAQGELRSALSSSARLEEQLKITKNFYNLGLRPRLEVLQAELDANEAKDAVLTSKNKVTTQKVRLNTLLNIPKDQKVEYVGDLSFIPFSSDLDYCLELAYLKRPDMLIALKSIEIARTGKVNAQSSYYPQVQLEGSWSTEGDRWSVDGSSRRPNNYNTWSVGVSGSLNIFEWGKSYYKVQQASSMISKVVAESEELRQEIAYEIEARLLELLNYVERIQVARTSLAQAEEAFRVANARYKSQVGAFIDVLDAQAKLTAAEVRYSSAQAEYLISLSGLYSALGEENPALLPKY